MPGGDLGLQRGEVREASAEALAAQAAQRAPVSRVFQSPESAVRSFFQALRPHQWVKNLILVVPLVTPVSRVYIDLCALVLVIGAAVGVWGFVLHATANLAGPSIHAFDNFVYGAPPMAPLLFPNLMLLGIIGLWQLRSNEAYLATAVA